MNPNSSLSSFCELLAEHDSFKKLVSEWKAHQAFNDDLCKILPAAYQKKVKLSCLKKGVAYLVAENNSIATACRYQLPQWLSQLRQLGTWAALASLQIRVEAEAFTEGQLLRVHHKQGASVAQLEKLICEYASHTESPLQKLACEDWLRRLNNQ